MSKLLRTLEMLVACPSLSKDQVTCRQLLKKVASEIPGCHHDAERGIIWWGHPDLGSVRWLINTHLDVVPGKKEQFLLRVAGDRAWGRGVADVKGCAAILIAQAREWASLAQQKGITFMLVSDEEVGGQNTQEILPQMKELHGAIFLEPTGLHLTTQAKGMMQIKIQASGRACHGSRPWEGKNAIESLARGLVQFRLTHPAPIKETRDTTFNFSQIMGGLTINQVPESAELWCDVRFNPEEDPATCVEKIQRCFSHHTVTAVKCESPINCDKKSAVFRSLASSLKANKINPLSQFDHGTSDARHATLLGVPALVFGPKGGGLHADNEWVSIKSLRKVQSVLDHWIKNI